jgi:hypothetical protein
VQDLSKIFHSYLAMEKENKCMAADLAKTPRKFNFLFFRFSDFFDFLKILLAVAMCRDCYPGRR